jgi:asparagine synthase (glutamine-hydrolysing)
MTDGSTMSFLVVFNSDYAPIGRERLDAEIASKNVQVLGKERQVAFIGSQTGSERGEDATRCEKLDRRFWLIGRIRLDARDELCSIVSGSQGALEDQSDALICLRAYARWGDRCLEYLRGDFCFVLWDEERQRLFCGRDQLGVRPLFYTRRANNWLISDSLDAIVTEVSLTGDLDNYWLADFLISGFCKDLDRTVYKHVKRLPPAHFLSVDARSGSVQKYWVLEIHDPIYYPRPSDYVERFQEVVTLAIRDRLPQDRVGISMSGGLDSSTLAALALRATGDASRVVAHTRHFERLMADEEAYFSPLVANRLGVRLALRAIDNVWYDPQWHKRELWTPEPNSSIVRAAPERIIAAEMAKLAQVWFYGEGPDNALTFEWYPYLRWLFKKADWRHFGEAVVQYLLSKQAREWGATIDGCLKRWPTSERKPQLSLPQWLDEEFIEELQLVGRSPHLLKNNHPWHPRAVASFTGSLWPHFLEQLDPLISGSSLVWRHPYLDLRVLTFLLSVPPIPWARRKLLIRKAMRDFLPEEILSRDKAPLSGNPVATVLEKQGLPDLALEGPILRYVNRNKLPKTPDASVISQLIRVYALDSWLNSRAPGGALSQIGICAAATA